MREVFDEQGDVRSSLAKRAHFARKHAEPIEQVGSESAVGRRGSQVSIGCCDHADVHVDRSTSSDTCEFAFLQDTQQHDLGLGGQLADLVEEYRSAVGQLEATLAPLQGS